MPSEVNALINYSVQNNVQAGIMLYDLMKLLECLDVSPEQKSKIDATLSHIRNRIEW